MSPVAQHNIGTQSRRADARRSGTQSRRADARRSGDARGFLESHRIAITGLGLVTSIAGFAFGNILVGSICILLLLIYYGQGQNILSILCCLVCLFIGFGLLAIISKASSENEDQGGGKKKSIKRNSRYHKKKYLIRRKTKLKIHIANNIRYNKSGGDNNTIIGDFVLAIFRGLGYMLIEGCWEN